MSVFHTDGVETNTPSTPAALQRLNGALTKLWSQRAALEDFEGFECEVHALYGEAEREVLVPENERFEARSRHCTALDASADPTSTPPRPRRDQRTRRHGHAAM